MDIQLRYIFNILYKGDSALLSCLAENRNWYDEDDDDDSTREYQSTLSAYLNRRQMYRWILPRMKDNTCRVLIDDAMETAFEAHQTPIKKITYACFIREHLEPIYPRIARMLEPEQCDQHLENLHDLMGRKNNKFKGCGSTLSTIILESVSERDSLQSLVNVQCAILNLYNYRADQFRKAMIDLVNDAIQGKDGTQTDSITLSRLQQLRTMLLTLLSQGQDAMALTALMLYSIFPQKFFTLFPLFQGKNLHGMFQLNNSVHSSTKQQLTNGLVLTYDERYNYIGGYGSTDITLWDEKGRMVDKISDIFGYFFYPVTLSEQSNLRYARAGESNSFPISFDSIENDCTLCTWIYQEEGRYHEDDDGYGATSEEEILLYAIMDHTGRFITPFLREVPKLEDQ